ncbi:MAG: cytochrome c family protein [Nitrospirota bacterium]|nr:cytochrome c family protein [Nitrospirota bacterium]MDH5587617.1 cytochrome c family protein [Nitrospirota bacterium]MDH5773941.1 cytochrome c family protein [Nitrospirota bacterium]
MLNRFAHPTVWRWNPPIVWLGSLVLVLSLVGIVRAQGESAVAEADQTWIEEIEQTFIPSEQCKQCHDRHYEEWKGMREQTMDLKTFGRVDGALLHGTALTSPVFQTVLGLWLQTKPDADQRNRCLSCHAPSVTVFPQHTDRIIEQVMKGRKHVTVEGISCSACHLISGTQDNPNGHPTFKISAGATIFGPYAEPDENLVHPSKQADVYKGAHYCASCHFGKVKDVMREDIPGEILKGTICQDCHMEQSTGSSTSQRGALTRPIGRHWFQGIVIPGIMLSNRNLQAEWFSRVDIDVKPGQGVIEGEVLVKNGALPHSFPGGDPVLKQFFVTVTLKTEDGQIVDQYEERFGKTFEELLRGPIPRPLVNGGTTRHIPFSLKSSLETKGLVLEAALSYALIPTPTEELKAAYLATLPTDKDREKAEAIIQDYSSPRLLTFRTMNL